MSAALLARVAGEVRAVRPDLEARQRLERLLSNLRTFRGELADAEREGLDLVAASAREVIRTLQEQIRQHCAETGIAMPGEAPEVEA